MAATLQEVQLANLPCKAKGEGSNSKVVAIHRRSQTVLSFFFDKNTGTNVYESNVCNSYGNWNACQRPWSLATDSLWAVARVIAIETLDCFVFVCNYKKKAQIAKAKPLPAHASLAERRQREQEEKDAAASAQIACLIFCDLSLQEINRYNISQFTKNTISAADFDQNRKELVLGCLGGRIQSYSVRFVEASRQGKAHYIGVFRLHNRLSEEAGKVPLQIAVQDVASTSLVLSKHGGISSFANGTLEQMWFVSNGYFRCEPRTIFADKFGGNFVVHCKSDSSELLEYWKPPSKFTMAEAGEFERSVLPLNDKPLVGLTLENICSATGTFVVYMTESGVVQLWRPTVHGEMRLDSELKIKLSPTSSEPASKSGLICFVQNRELPDCPISLFVVNGASICSLALHAPNDTAASALREISLARRGERDIIFPYYSGRNGGTPMNVDQLFAAKKESDYLLAAEKALMEAKRRNLREQAAARQAANDSEINLDSRLSTAQQENRPGTTHYISERLHPFYEDATNDLTSASNASSEATMKNSGNVISLDVNLNQLNGDPPIDWDRMVPSEDRLAFSQPPPVNFQQSQFLSLAPKKTSAFFFIPMKCLRDYDASGDDASQPDGIGFLRLLGPPSVISATSRNKSVLKLVAEKGLLESGSMDAKTLEYNFAAIAPKAGTLGLVTVFNQGFVFDARQSIRFQSSHAQPPIRLDLNIRQQAKSTAILVADVSVTLLRAVNTNGRTDVVESEIDGHHTLCFFGDSDGRLNYSLCDRAVAIHTDSFDAHSSAIVSIVATGDPSASLWRVGTELRNKGLQVLPKAGVGSAIISMARNGEVKVWQPIFMDLKGIASSKELLFNVCGLAWRCSGVFTCRVPNAPSALAVGSDVRMPELRSIEGGASKCFLDPTGMSVIIAFTDGSLEQWPLPGLLDLQGLSTTRERVWRSKRHKGIISDGRVHMHLPSTCIKALKPENMKKLDPDVKKKDMNPIVSQLGGRDGQDAIGYTLKELKTIADSSSLVTSSLDGSVVLWRFAVSSDDSYNSLFKYLNPSPVRRFAFSSVPTAGLCYSTSDTSKPATQSIWRLTAIVNGVLVTATHGIRSEAFRVNVSLLNDADFEEAAVSCDVADKRTNPQDETLQFVPVICTVNKPSLTTELVSKKVGKNQGIFSWNTLDCWSDRKKSTSDTLISQQFSLDENVTFDGVDKKIPSTGTAWHEEPGAGELAKVDVEVEETKDYKPEVIKDGKKKVHLKGIRLSVPLSSTTALSESLMRDENGAKKFLASAAHDEEIPVAKVENDEDINDEIDDFEVIGNAARSLQHSSDKLSLVLPSSQTESITSPAKRGALDEDSVLSLNSLRSPAQNKDTMTDSLLTAEISFEASSKPSLNQPSLTAGAADPPSPKSKLASSKESDKGVKEEAREEVKIVGEFGEVKQTRVQLLKKKEVDKVKARLAATISINPKVMYRSKPREVLETGTRQISGSASIFTVPVNFSDQQLAAATRRVVVEKDAKTSDFGIKPPSAVAEEKDTVGGESAGGKLRVSQRSIGLGLETATSVAESATGPILVNFSAPSIFYGKPPEKKKVKYEPRNLKKPKIDPSLIPEGSDALSLLGQTLLSQLTELQHEGMACLVDAFSDKDMDAFELLSDENKLATLNMIGQQLRAFKETGAKFDIKDAAKKGLVQMKQYQLAERAATRGRKRDGLTQVLQVSDPEAEPDILLVLKNKDIYSAQVMLMTPNVGAKVFMFAMIDGAVPQPLPTEHLFETATLTEIAEFPGIACVVDRVLDERESEHVFDLKGLKPGRGYKIFAYMVCTTPSERTFRKMTIVESMECAVTAVTLPEVVDMPWSYLTPSMQDIEIKAALRTAFVLAASQAEERPLALPTEADFTARDPNTSAGRAALKKVQLFVNWWAPDAFGGLSVHRKQFLFRESVHACRDEALSKKYKDAGFIDADGLKALQTLADKVSEDKSSVVLEGSLLEGNQDFFNFRSWHIGGQVILDWEEEQFFKSKSTKLSSPRSLDNSKIAMSDDDISVGSDNADEAFSPKLPMKNREQRAAFLKDCYTNNVDSAAEKTQALIDIYKAAEKQGLSERDLTLRRAKLSDADIDMIMASMKLVDLCIARELLSKGKRLDPSMLGRGALSAQNICGCDIFSPINEAILIPEKPPSLVMATLPGTTRRPIRPWQLCTPEEQLYELCLACSFDYILEIAIMDGISVPDVEDVDLDSKVAPMRHQRWKDFAKWYAGDEAVEKIPGRGIPTLARVLIAEEWEGKALCEDFSILDVLIQLGVAVPDELKELNVNRLNKVRESGNATDVPSLTKAQKDDVMMAYENSLNTSVGVAIRLDLFKFYINALVKARREQMIHFLWPPGAARNGHQFLFPRLGLISGQIEMPDVRIQLFPSKSNASHTHAQIMGWYTEEELNVDDRLMFEAEEDGRRRRAYLEWLALESVRVAESRLLMLAEDKEGQVRRKYFATMEDTFGAIKKLPPNQNKTDFTLASNLPGAYEFIGETTTIFADGTGVDNEDELEDIRQAQLEAAEKAKRDAAEKKRLYDLEMKRLAREEELRIQREERDRRLAENMEMRRKTREHIEELKRRRIAEKEEAIRKAREAIIEAEAQRLRQEEEKKIREGLEYQKLLQRQDRQQMKAEDEYMQTLIIRKVETRLMEHEDIVSSMREMVEKRAEAESKIRIAELNEIYHPFEPFAFQPDKVRLPALHSVLSDTLEESTAYSSVYRSRFSQMESAMQGWTVDELTGLTGEFASESDQMDWIDKRATKSVSSAGSQSLTAEESELLGPLSIDESFVGKWFRIPKNVDDLQTLLLASINKKEAEARRKKAKRNLRPSDQEPVIWKGLSADALLILEADKERYEISKGLKRPTTSGGVPSPFEATAFPVAKYVLTERSSPRRPATADSLMRPSNRLEPISVTKQTTGEVSELDIGERKWDASNNLLDESLNLASKIDVKQKQLVDVLIKNAEVAKTVMQSQRLQSLSAKKLTLASLAAMENYESSGKRKHKPRNFVEKRKEPELIADANKLYRDTVHNYVDSAAVQQDKFYFQSVMPGVRKEPSIDESVRKFSLEIQTPAEELFSPSKLSSDSLTNTTNGKNKVTKKHKLLKILRSDSGKPNDAARFNEKNKYKAADVISAGNGFGIRGSTIPIKDVDPRMRPQQKRRILETPQLENASSLQLFSQIEASAMDVSFEGDNKVVDAFLPQVSHTDNPTASDVNSEIDAHESVVSLMTEASAVAVEEAPEIAVLVANDVDDNISVNSEFSDASRGKLSRPASIAISIKSSKSPAMSVSNLEKM